jgi:predicted nucleotidyltransferase
VNNVEERTILVTLGGSRAYGTETEGSDVDFKGVFIGTRASYLSIASCPDTLTDLKDTEDKWTDHYAQFLSPELQLKEREGTSYELRKFCKLALQCNPNILDTLFCDENDVVYAHAYGSMIRRARQYFLSKTALNSFQGYAMSQLHLVEGLLRNPEEGPRLLTHCDTAEASRNRGKMTTERINKHAAHVVRLLQSFEELLLTGTYNVKRSNRDELLAIRAGNWKMEWLREFIEEQKAKLPALQDKCILPPEPNIKVVQDLVLNIVSDAFFGRDALDD